MRQLGIGRGDTVALHSETRAEFYLADLGVLTNGSIAAALYTTYPLADQAKNVRASHAKAVFMEDPKSMQALIAEGGGTLAGLQWILLTGEAEGALTLEQLRAKGRAAAEERSTRSGEDSRGSARQKILRFYISPPAPQENRKWAWSATRR